MMDARASLGGCAGIFLWLPRGESGYRESENLMEMPKSRVVVG